jgi:hypothetical protein
MSNLINGPGIQGMAILLGLGVFSRVNKWLSKLVINNYSSSAGYDWKKEIIILTGESSGIGARIATKLAERGSQVVILDVNPPSWKLRTKHFCSTPLTIFAEYMRRKSSRKCSFL